MPDMPLSIVISKIHLSELERHAKESLPNESCAFLLGMGLEEIVVSEVMLVKNAQSDRVSFTIPSDEILKAYRSAEEKKMRVTGIFHSHPARPEPSLTDARFMEINPVVWLIYSTTENRFAAWILADKVRPVEIVTG